MGDRKGLVNEASSGDCTKDSLRLDCCVVLRKGRLPNLKGGGALKPADLGGFRDDIVRPFILDRVGRDMVGFLLLYYISVKLIYARFLLTHRQM